MYSFNELIHERVNEQTAGDVYGDDLQAELELKRTCANPGLTRLCAVRMETAFLAIKFLPLE